MHHSGVKWCHKHLLFLTRVSDFFRRIFQKTLNLLQVDHWNLRCCRWQGRISLLNRRLNRSERGEGENNKTLFSIHCILRGRLSRQRSRQTGTLKTLTYLWTTLSVPLLSSLYGRKFGLLADPTTDKGDNGDGKRVNRDVKMDLGVLFVVPSAIYLNLEYY